MKNKPYQTGMTLIEIMIALLIGAFLLGGVLQIFTGSKQTYRMQEGLSRLQENGRFAMDFISNDIRMAGYRGCNGLTPIAGVSNDSTVFLSDFNTSIQGFESTSSSAWTPAINAAITSPLGGSDVITIRRANEQGNLVTAHVTGSANLTLAATTGLAAGDVVLVSDCSGAEAFQISSIGGNVITLQSAPSRSYNGGEVSLINTSSYYVRSTPIKTDRATITANDRLSLYRRTGSNGAEELVEGIEQIHVWYGVDTDLNPATGISTDYVPNYYVTANTVNTANNWASVVSIRISLLAVTLDDNLAAQPLAYTYNNATTTPADRKIRRGFNTTIALRNRLP